MLTHRGLLSSIHLIAPKERALELFGERLPPEGAHLAIELANGAIVAVPALLAPLAQALIDAEHPAYLEVADGIVQTILVPVPYVVRRISPPSDAGVQVTLHISNATHELKADHPRYEELLGKLREALATGQLVLVTEPANSTEIIDVSFVDNHDPQVKRLFTSSLTVENTTEYEEADADLHRQFADKVFDVKTLVATSDELFKFLAGQAGIPFKYPRDGCWARASEMCRLLGTKGVASHKLWLYRSGTIVATDNDPDCVVTWGYHVAPLVDFKQGDGTVVQQVFDPSLFDRPVGRTDWEQRQHKRFSQVELLQNPAVRGLTPSAVYFRNCNGGTLQFDAKFEDTNVQLKRWQLKLTEQIQGHGPPPYKCPKS